MSTRSMIGIENNDGTIKAIYCHWDGYPEHNGKILKRYYNTPEKVEELINLGNLSSLNKNIGVKHDFDDFEFFEKNEQVSAYGRDREEADNEPIVYTNFQNFVNSLKDSWIEYFYIFNTDDEWEIWGWGKGDDDYHEKVIQLE